MTYDPTRLQMLREEREIARRHMEEAWDDLIRAEDRVTELNKEILTELELTGRPVRDMMQV